MPWHASNPTETAPTENALPESALPESAPTESPLEASPHKSTDDAPSVEVLQALRQCYASWEPMVRVLGNVRAIDAERAISDALAVLATDSTLDSATLARAASELVNMSRGYDGHICQVLNEAAVRILGLKGK